MLLLFTPYAYAHSGRTDSNGGHKDNKNKSGLGSYHYHHGYGPHLHPGGVCPYDSSINNAEENVFSFSTADNMPKSSPSPLPSQKTELALPSKAIFPNSSSSSQNSIDGQSKQKEETSHSSAILYILIGIFVLPTMIGVISNLKDKIKRKKGLKIKQESFYAAYSGKTIREIVNIPFDTEIGDDGYPKIKGIKSWGKRYTVYVSHNGNRYHSKECKWGTAPINIANILQKELLPCSVCKPKIEDLHWYKKYLEFKQVMKEAYIVVDSIDSLIINNRNDP